MTTKRFVKLGPKRTTGLTTPPPKPKSQKGRSEPATTHTRAIADEAHQRGITPLEFLLKIMWQEPDGRWNERLKKQHMILRFQAAVATLPYMHPKLQTTHHTGLNGPKDEIPPQITYTVDPEATDEDPSH